MTISDIVNAGTEQPGPPGSAMRNVSQRWRLAVTLVEILLLIVFAYLLVTIVYQIITPRPDVYAALQSQANVSQQRTDRVDYKTIVSFDPFYRETGSAPQTQAAPESNLRLVITGLRTDGTGGGAAIIDAQDGGQKLVTIGGEISPGISLSEVYADRVVINRRGARETVYMVKPKAPTQASSAVPVLSRQPIGNTLPEDFGGILAGLRLEPVRRNGRIGGFRVQDETSPTVLQAVGIEVGDIIIAVNGSRLSSFERLQELGEELRGAARIKVEIERRGQPLALTL